MRDALMQLNVFKNSEFASIQAILTGDSNDKRDTDLASTILRYIIPPCHSILNQGNADVANIIFNRPNISLYGTIPNSNSKTSIHGGKEVEVEIENEKGVDKDEPNPKKDNTNTSKGPDALLVRPLTTSYKYLWLANSNNRNNNNVRPLNIRAKLEDDQVRLMFNVSHTQPAVVKRFWTFDGEVKFLKGPEEYGLQPGELISSIVEFTYNASVCQANEETYSQYKNENFLFRTRENVLGNEITIAIPTCIFSFDNKNNETELSQDLFYPDFWEKVNVSEITSTLREDATFQIEVQVSANNEIQLMGIIYDPMTNLINDTNFLRLNGKSEGDNITVDTHNSENSINTTKVLFENVKRINGTIPGLKPIITLDDSPEQVDPYYMSATAMFSLSLPNDKTAVMLRLANRYSFRKKADDGISFYLVLKKIFSYKSSNMEHAFPEGKFRIGSKKK